MAKNTRKAAAPRAQRPAAETLRGLRERLNLTIGAAAQLMGWTPGMVARAEAGPGNESPVAIDTLAAGFERAQNSRRIDPSRGDD